MVRIKDIADHVGVSTATVSNVIHGKAQRVSEETRKKIEAAIKEMGYVPSMSGLMLAQKRSNVIGVILTGKNASGEPALADPYYSLLIGYLDRYIREKGQYMLLLSLSDTEEIIQQTKSWNLDGLIACDLQTDRLHQLHQLCDKPMVSLDAYLGDRSDYINIMTDDFGGGYQMGNYLLSMGHRKILMISDDEHGSSRQRWLGFQKALQKNHVPVADRQHLLITGGYGERMAQLKQQQGLIREQTALFFSSDLYALEAFTILRDMGLRIPEDISVAGFSDLLYADLAQPKLTTMHQDIEQKAQMAVDALSCLIKGKKTRDWILPVKLVERGSVRRIGNWELL